MALDGAEGADIMDAVREMLAARDELKIAPTHNSVVFDKALERHKTAIRRLREMAARP